MERSLRRLSALFRFTLISRQPHSQRENDPRKQLEKERLQPGLASELPRSVWRFVAQGHRLASRRVQVAARRRRLGHHRFVETRGAQKQMSRVRVDVSLFHRGCRLEDRK